MVAVAHPLVQPLPQRRVRHLQPVPSVPPARTGDGGPGAAAYRRRRVVALVVAVLVVVAMGSFARAVVAAVTLPPAPAGAVAPPVVSGPAALEPGDVYIVQPGDTLWSIAGRVSPGEDPRSTVDRLAAQRGDGPLRPGERIAIP